MQHQGQILHSAFVLVAAYLALYRATSLWWAALQHPGSSSGQTLPHKAPPSEHTPAHTPATPTILQLTVHPQPALTGTWTPISGTSITPHG